MEEHTKDWDGNKKAVWATLGASNHSNETRQEDDYYATDPEAVNKLLEAVNLPETCWECCCGEGHMSKRLEELNHTVISTDLIDRGYGDGGIDFLQAEAMPEGCSCIITNPPYKYALPIIKKALELLPDGGICAMFLKTTFLEGKKRYTELFNATPPKYMLQFINRVVCAKNGDFEEAKKIGGSAVSYAWFIWEKGYTNNTIIKWI